jgi:predicted porin
MNKKLIALAVAGASLAPAAMAQTANPVTLYGRVYVTMESVEAKGGANPVVRRNRVEDQSSLFGIRGTEDLGGGLKAFFQLETAFRPDQNNTVFAARNSGVGLQGGWGSFLLGRWDTPYKTATTAVDPYGDLTISGITGVLNDGGNFDRRDMNSVQYWSPNWAGFAFRLMATANERKNDPAGVNARDTGANVTFTRGPVYAFLAWEEHKDQVGGSGNAFGQLPAGTTVVNGVSGAKEEGAAGGANFTIGPVKLGGQYQEYKKTNRDKQKAWMGNLVWTIGNNQIIYQYMQSKDGKLNTATAEPDCKSNSIAYQYNFSRRTFVIASYVKVDNNDFAACNFGSNRLAAAAGQDPQGVFAGIRHIF